MNDLNLDVTPAEEARALHRVVRAMHDGHCPVCGFLEAAEAFRITTVYLQDGYYCCPECSFTVTSHESDMAMQQFQPFMQKSIADFKKWRDNGYKPLSETNDETP